MFIVYAEKDISKCILSVLSLLRIGLLPLSNFFEIEWVCTVYSRTVLPCTR